MARTAPAGGFFIQSTAGRRGHFEVTIPWHHGGLAYFVRDNDDPYHKWHGPQLFGDMAGPGEDSPPNELYEYTSCTLAESTYRSFDNDRPANFEVFARRRNGAIDHYVRENGGGFQWRRSDPPHSLANIVNGNPSLVVAGRKIPAVGIPDPHANWNLVVPLAMGGFETHIKGLDRGSRLVWKKVEVGHALRMRYVHLCASTLYHASTAWDGSPGRYFLVCVTEDQELQLFRSEGVNPFEPDFDWQNLSGMYTFGYEILRGTRVEAIGRPSMIQSTFGETSRPIPFTGRDHYGAFELMVPVAGGGIKHFWKDNGEVRAKRRRSDAVDGWHEGVTIGEGDYVECSLIQSNFGGGDHKNLELVALRSDRRGFEHFWRDERLAWYGPKRVN